MKWIDTHAHLYLDKFQDDLDEVFQRMKTEGVDKVFLPNIDLNSLPGMMKLVDDYPEVAYPMIGLHPCDVKENYQEVLSKLKAFYLNQPERFIAVGEIGIDLYWDQSTLKIQIDAFVEQISWAKQWGLPIVIHCRDSFDEIFEVLESEKSPELYGVLHCFTGDENQARKAIDLNMKLGIGGVATFKNGGLDKALKNIPIEEMVVETDSPFLAPTPYRGKRNESSYIPLIGSKLAEITGRRIEEVAEITTQNAKRIFNI